MKKQNLIHIFSTALMALATEARAEISENWRQTMPTRIEIYFLYELRTIADQRDRGILSTCTPYGQNSAWAIPNNPTHFETRHTIDLDRTEERYRQGFQLQFQYQVRSEHFNLRHGVRERAISVPQDHCIARALRIDAGAMLANGERIHDIREITSRIRTPFELIPIPNAWTEVAGLRTVVQADFWLDLFENSLNSVTDELPRIQGQEPENHLENLESILSRIRYDFQSAIDQVLTDNRSQDERLLRELGEVVIGTEGQCNESAYRNFLDSYERIMANPTSPLSPLYQEGIQAALGFDTRVPVENHYLQNLLGLSRRNSPLHFSRLLELTLRPACEAGAPPSQLEFETPEVPAARPQAPRNPRNRRGNIR